MPESHKAVGTNSQSRSGRHGILLSSVAVIGVTVLLGGAFAYQEMGLPDSHLQVHAAPYLRRRVKPRRSPPLIVSRSPADLPIWLQR